ncbi:MAG TPA: hypothetical protein VN947_10710 [Polyangia bacterium]|nr:hypothetical protein [Polyangia bacterium]
MTGRLAALVLCVSATGCRPGPTTLALDISAAPGVTVQSLTLHLALGSDDAGVAEALPPSGAMPALPGRAVVRLPDVAMQIAVELDGEDVDGNPLSAATTVEIVPHQEVTASLTLGAAADVDLGGDMAAPFDAGQPCSLGARCNYAHRRPLTIHNGAAAALPTGYTVRVPLDITDFPSGSVLASLNDVRVFGDPPAGEYDRVVDLTPPGQTRALWIALARPIAAGASDTSYSIYYGDPAAGAPPADATRVFPFYDGFDNGAQLSPFWQSNGGPVVGSGTLTLHKNTADAVTTVAASDTVPLLSALEWRARQTDPTSTGQSTTDGTFWSWIGYQHTGDFSPSDPWIVWIVRGPTDLHAERKITGSASCAGADQCNGPTIAPDAVNHVYRIERDAATTRFYYDGGLSYTIADPNTVDYAVMIRNYAVTSDLVVDWIRGRALASPEPAVTVGAEATP